MFKAIVYHGRENHQSVKEDIVCFSSSETFSKKYGVVRPYQLRLSKPFDSCLKDDIDTLLELVGSLHDNYTGTTYNSYEELVESALLYSDTWKLFEPNMRTIRELGYDGMIMYEGGVQNYVSFYSSTYKPCNPKLQLAIAL